MSTDPKKPKEMNTRNVIAIAPINIATIKYWGKSDEEAILPLNPSISATISTEHIRTRTAITATRNASCNGNSHTDDILILNGSESILTKRMKSVIKTMRNEARKNGCSLAEWSLRIESHNNFPTAAGLASSASGMACLVFALQHIFELPGNFSNVARLGSGSACRSMFGGFVEWTHIDDKDKSQAEVIANANHWSELRIIICVASDRQKSQSSTVGMQLSVKTSNLLEHRVKNVLPDRLDKMRTAILERDFSSFAELTMKDSNQLHAVCMDTFPPISYLTSASHRIIRLIHDLNSTAKHTIAAYTFDAGPNAFIFVEDKNINEVLLALRKKFPRAGEDGKLEELNITGNSDIKENQKVEFNESDDYMVDGLKQIICVCVGDGPKLELSVDS